MSAVGETVLTTAVLASAATLAAAIVILGANVAHAVDGRSEALSERRGTEVVLVTDPAGPRYDATCPTPTTCTHVLHLQVRNIGVGSPRLDQLAILVDAQAVAPGSWSADNLLTPETEVFPAGEVLHLVITGLAESFEGRSHVVSVAGPGWSTSYSFRMPTVTASGSYP